MNVSKYVVTIGIYLLLGVSFASGQSLSEVAFFNRCYSHLTGKPVPLGHPAMAQVRAGKIKALDACKALLDKAELDPSGPLILRTDAEAKAILNNFYNFHRTWFPTNNVEQIQDYNDEISRGTVDIYDSTEPGLAITRAVFARGASYSDVLNLSYGVRAQREENLSVRNQYGFQVNFPGRRDYGNNFGLNENLYHFRALSGGFNGNSDTTNSIFLNIPKIEIGELVGIRLTTESLLVPNVSLQPLGPDRAGNTQQGLNYSYDFYKTYGGGVIGSPIYFLLNYGHGRGLEANGTTKLPRRWSQTNMSAFLCSELPALRESDIKKFIVGNSSAPFRNSGSCVMCHATIDPMAYTARNLVMGNSDYTEFSAGSRTHAKNALMLLSYRDEIPSDDTWHSEPVAGFHRMTPKGRLFFRSMTGELVDRPVHGIAQLGAVMSQTTDFYYCAAKRYFEYFTGIQVPLYDRQNPANAHLNRALSAEAIEDRKFVEALGEGLRTSNSVREMLKQIMSSKYYRSVNYRE
ncbi:hypothetical protein [Bdellovibrio bacteriovorus]|uniref:hypothetical protein n=1 Tax=Bdellovibrio bacteriovorus TaxID=959 RepID=UPI0035A6386F